MKTWKDVYQLPLKLDKSIFWVYDDNYNFVFQFETEDEVMQEEIINIINNPCDSSFDEYFEYRNTLVVDSKGNDIIMIRGYGNLTSKGGLNLSDEEACNIQDTFGKFIVDRLNERTM